MTVRRKPYPTMGGATVSRRTVDQKKVARVMEEFKRGDLQSSSGHTVTKPAQAIAISLNEGRRAKRK